MNNADFAKLLTSNDTALVNELTKGKPKKPGGEGKGKGKSRGKDDAAIARIAKANKYKEKAAAQAAKAAKQDEYQDRAKMRRDMKGEYEQIAAEFENIANVDKEESKYLGGDVDHTHLVKGLDFSLLSKVRAEIEKKNKVDQIQKERQERKAAGGKKTRTFDNLVAKNIWLAVVETLHPHHVTFKERVHKMGKAIALGQRIRGAPSAFLPGRMAFEFDTEMKMAKSDIPRIVYSSKEDAPAAEASRRPSGMLPDTALKVKTAMARAIEERKNRKLQKASLGKESSYTAAQKMVSKVKAKDADDIFGDAGAFDVGEIVKKARAEQAAKRAGKEVKEEAPLASTSYFDDAGSEKYKKAPEGQIDLDELAVEESNLEAGEFHKPTGAFKPSSKWKGPKKNWVFKLGDQGLGYYEEIPPKSKDSDAPQKLDPRRKSSRKPKADKVGMGGDVDDAYDELFPETLSGGAMVTTGSDDSDDEDGEKKKKGLTTTIGKGKDKDKNKDEDTLSANKKGAAEAKKRKRDEKAQWQKIDTMIKKGKTSSMESLEQEASKKKGRASHLATPAFF